MQDVVIRIRGASEVVEVEDNATVQQVLDEYDDELETDSYTFLLNEDAAQLDTRIPPMTTGVVMLHCEQKAGKAGK